MKNKNLKLKFFLLTAILILLSLSFYSCNNSLDEDSSLGQKVTLKGTIALSGALPSELVNGSLEADSPSRAAFPTKTGCTYSVTAVSANPAESVTGTISGKSYSIELTLGRTYKVTAALKNGDSDVFSDDWENVEVTRENAATLSHDFILKGKSGGSGSIELNITVPASIKSVDSSSSSSVWNSSSPTFTLDSTTATLSCSSIGAGTYEVELNFYNSTDESNRILLYSCTQSINVVAYMETNSWKESSSSASPISGGSFTLTDELIASFVRTQIYVGSTNLTLADGNPVIASDTTGSGSPYAPFATFEKALNIITNQGASDKDYTIWISGTITGTKTLSSSLDGKAKSITISGTSGNSTDVLDGNNGGTTLTISTSVSVTIKKLKITGGKNASGNGGGIYISDSAASLALGDGVLVTGNTAVNGGGIYSKGKLYLYGSAMVGKETNSVATSSSYGNKADISGAGIYTSSGSSLYLGYKSENETSPLTGGVCGNYLSNSSNSTARGGGLYNDGATKFLIASGNISYNYAMNGAGLYTRGNVTMTGGNVERNEGKSDNDSGCGGGLYVGNGTTLSMSDNASIKGNKNIAKGAGVYLDYNNCTLSMTGGTISENIAGIQGGAVYMHDLNENYFSQLQIGAEAYIPYGGEEKNNDIFLLDTHATVTIISALEKHSPEFPLASTYPDNKWKRGNSVATAGGSLTNLTPYKDFFAFTQEGWECKVSGDNKNLLLDSPIYVAGSEHSVRTADGNDTNGTGTKSKPFATIEKACSLLTVSTVDYTIYIDGKLTVKQTIPSTINAKSLTIQGTDSSATIDAGNTGTALTINKNIKITILKLTITKGNITGSSNTNVGGGIHISTGDVTLGDGTEENAVLVEGNRAYNGGGIYNAGTLTIKDGVTFSSNSLNTLTVVPNGAGIRNTGTLNIEGGKICENDANGYSGAGIYNTSTVNMTGGEISNNKTTVDGGAVYNSGTFNISGSAYIPYGVTKDDSSVQTGKGQNEVYLPSGKVITVTGALTGTTPVATITPASYVFNISVLGGTSNLIAANYKKFAVVPQTVDDKSYEWFVSSTGILYTVEYLITSDSLASFSPNSSVSYTLTVDSTVGNDELSSLISKIKNNVADGTTLDLSESSATNLTTWIDAKVSSITIPKNCTNISSQEFQSAEWLTEINVPETNTSYCSVDGVLYSKDMKKLVHYPPSKTDSTFTLPSTVTTFAYGAFEDNKYLETINGMTQITTLESMVTFRCTQKLKEIDLSGLTQSSLPYYTFEYSTSLEKVTLSSSITSIGLQCFQNSSTLKEVHFKSATPPSFAEPEKKEDLDYYKNFKNCPNVIFYVPSSAVDSYKNATGENGFVHTDYNGAADTTDGIREKIVGE